MKKIKVHIDNVCLKEKPKNFGLIKTRLQTQIQAEYYSIEEITDNISKGKTISPAVMLNGAKAINWSEETLYLIDIDNNDVNNSFLTVHKALNICKNNNLDICFYYYTFSNTDDKPKFRLAFVCDEVITDTNTRESIIRKLISLFPQVDISCKNADRLFYGTNKPCVIINREATFNKNKLLGFHKSDSVEIGNRNNTIFNNACNLLKCGLSKNEIKEKIHIINSNFSEPLDYKEVEKTIESALSQEILPNYIICSSNGNRNISTQKLAQHIREHAHYFFEKNQNSNYINIFWYENGVYKHINEDVFKSYIKDYITKVDYNLYKSYIINEVYKDLTTDRVFIEKDEVNKEEKYINFENCILDIETMEMIPHSSKIISTIQIPCIWSNNDTETPVFDGYINDLSNYQNDVKSTLLQYMGACMSNVKGYRFKKALFCVGDGNTGKSQLKCLTESLLGKNNYSGVDLSKLEERFGTSNLYNKRLAGTSDMSFISIKELNEFKKLTGGDSISIEFKGKDGFSYTYNGFLWFCCNKLPKFSGDNGDWVYNRIIVIKCNNVIPYEKQDKMILDKMILEKNGIIRKAICEFKKAIDNGYKFIISDEINNNSENYKKDND
ncbi:MAG: phage/plasmid primase, P4 family, partial [Clostridia bacterium]